MSKKPGRNTAIAAERDSIRKAGVLAFLLDVVQGKPAPIRDAAGRIIDWTDAPDLPLRVSTAQSLVRKILPDLQAQSIDLQTSGESTLRLVLSDGLAPPGIRSIDDQGVGDEIDCLPAPTGIENPACVQPPNLEHSLHNIAVSDPAPQPIRAEQSVRKILPEQVEVGPCSRRIRRKKD